MLDDLRELVEADPDDYFGRFCFGKALLEAGDAAGAVPQLEACIRLNGDYPVAHRYLGAAYDALQRSEDALRVWQDGIAVADRTALYQAGKEMQVFVKRLQARRT